MKQEIKELLNKFEFVSDEKQPLLFRKKIDENTDALIDFRKAEHKEKGRRFIKQGDNFDIDPDTIPELKMFKEERDKILQSSVIKNDGNKEQGTENKESNSSLDSGREILSKQPPCTPPTNGVKIPAAPTSNLLKVIKDDYEADILEVFGDSGSCKTKLMVLIALEGKRDGKKVRFVDTERNLRKAEIAALGDSYQYLPGISDLNGFCKKLPTDPDIIIIDSIGYPILTEFSKMSANQKGSALMQLIAWFGDLKDWAINNNKLVIVTNQPDSDFAKEAGYINRPFGDKARFAAKEIWEMKRLGMQQGVTKSAIRTFRSRIKGYGLDVAQIEINDNGTIIKM